jgi:CubicO group peptidase (beta-lactamase class C family)
MSVNVSLVDRYLSQVEAFGFSGAILIGLEEEVIFQKAYGFANVEENRKSQLNTVYDIGSITKPFTAVAIMKLVEDQKLGLHDCFVSYLDSPELSWPEEKREITIFHLLTHTSGIEDTIEDDYKDETAREVLTRIMNEPLISKPGERYQYSNDGFTLLAMVLEKVAGQEYEDFLKRTIFGPANLTQTGYLLPNWDLSSISHGYVNFEDQGHSLQKKYPTWGLKGNGGMFSTLADMFQFHLALEKNIILNQQTRDLMYAPYLNRYGCGWKVEEHNGETIISHGGASYYGTSAMFYRNVTSKLTIVLFCNQSYDHFSLSKQLMHNIQVITESNEPENLLKMLSEPILFEPLSAHLQHHNTVYKYKDQDVEIKWGRYFGMMEANSSELVQLLANDDEQELIKQTQVIVQEMLQLQFDRFEDVYGDKSILEDRVKSINNVFTRYQNKNGQIDRISIFGVGPSVLIKNTSEVRIELKNNKSAESKYMYFFWKNNKELQMAGFANVKDKGTLLVKPLNTSGLATPSTYISLRISDHQHKKFTIMDNELIFE